LISWKVTHGNLSVNGSNEVVVNGSVAQGSGGNLLLSSLVQQMASDGQFKLL